MDLLGSTVGAESVIYPFVKACLGHFDVGSVDLWQCAGEVGGWKLEASFRGVTVKSPHLRLLGLGISHSRDDTHDPHTAFDHGRVVEALRATD